MSYYNGCSEDFYKRFLSKNEQTSVEPNLEDLTKMVFYMMRELEYAKQEIKELKKTPAACVEEVEAVPVFPTLLKQDLLDFLEEGNKIACVVLKHNWPVKFQGKSLLVYDENETQWILATEKNEKAELLTERLRSELKKLLTTTIDVFNDNYPLYCSKVMSFKVTEVRKALKSKHKLQNDA
jgi:hypothetical protein